jgi:hypothetical protein
MPQITVENLVKTFVRRRAPSGLNGAFRSQSRGFITQIFFGFIRVMVL